MLGIRSGEAQPLLCDSCYALEATERIWRICGANDGLADRPCSSRRDRANGDCPTTARSQTLPQCRPQSLMGPELPDSRARHRSRPTAHPLAAAQRDEFTFS